MLRIADEYVSAVAGAKSGADLQPLVKAAIQLEFATIPPYLTAMLSLAPGANREIWGSIHAVVVDEMLHFAIGCNLLNALGGRPSIDDAGFVPCYPGPLPMSIGGGFEVGLEPFSLDLMTRVFMEIEEPEHPIDIPDVAAALPTFGTIGQFYSALIAKIQALGNGIFVGDPARQVMSANWFPRRLFPITNAADAVRALTQVVEEGEGTPLAPVNPEGEIAHYYRFQEIAKLKRIAKDTSVPEGYSFSGQKIPFELDAGLPADPQPADGGPRRRKPGRAAGTTVRVRLHQAPQGAAALVRR